jgi:hypothetical protein
VHNQAFEFCRDYARCVLSSAGAATSHHLKISETMKVALYSV